MGCKAGAYTKTGSNSIAMGTGATKCFEKNCYNIALGSAALQGGSSTPSENDGVHNVALGTNAGCSLTTGDCNIFGTFGAGSNLTTGSSNVFLGHNAGRNFTTGFGNIALGSAACGVFSGDATGTGNVLFGYLAGACISGGASYNTFIGYGAATNFICTITGSKNIIIGCKVGIADSTGSCQLAIGVGNTNWISGDSNFNVGIGTNVFTTAVGAGVTAKAYVGILSAYQLYGDGSALTGISAGGFSADADLNLFASNTCSGCNLDGTYDSRRLTI